MAVWRRFVGGMAALRWRYACRGGGGMRSSSSKSTARASDSRRRDIPCRKHQIGDNVRCINDLQPTSRATKPGRRDMVRKRRHVDRSD